MIKKEIEFYKDWINKEKSFFVMILIFIIVEFLFLIYLILIGLEVI